MTNFPTWSSDSQFIYFLLPRMIRACLESVYRAAINGTNLLPQPEIIEVRSSCRCGCPRVEFSVPVDSPFIASPHR